MSKSLKIKLIMAILITAVFLAVFFLLRNNLFLEEPGDLNATLFLIFGMIYAGTIVALIFWPVDQDPISSAYYDQNYKEKIPEKLKATNFLIWILVGLTLINWLEYSNHGGGTWMMPLLIPAIIILLILIESWLPFDFGKPLSQPTPQKYKISISREIKNPLWGKLSTISLIIFFVLVLLHVLFSILSDLAIISLIMNFGLIISATMFVIFVIIDRIVNKTVFNVKEDKISQYFSYMIYGVVVLFVIFISYIYFKGGFKDIGKVFGLY